MEIKCPDCQTKNCKNATIRNGRCLNFAPDNIKYSQHRFYRGLILPALTEALGESNNQYVHDFILKPEWIYRKTGEYYIKVNDYKDIPEKYHGAARILSRVSVNVETDEELTAYRENIIYGYIPSMSNFTRAETKDYFRFCEILLEEIGGQIPQEQNQEYNNLRKKVL